MQGEIRWARLALIFAAGGWVSLTTLEDTLLAKLLGMALGATLVMVSSHRLQGQSKWIVWVLIGSLMLAPTKSVFLAVALTLLALLYPASMFKEMAPLAVAKGLTIGVLLLYEIGLLSPELDRISWQVTHLLTQMAGFPGKLGAFQTHLILLLPAYFYLSVGLFAMNARFLASLLVLVAISITALMTTFWLWYGWALIFAMFMAPVRRSAHLRVDRRRVALAVACGGLALALVSNELRSLPSSSTSPRVGIVEGGLKTLDLPPAEPIRTPQEARFGNLLLTLPLYGIEAIKVPLQDLEPLLKRLDVLVVINPTHSFSPAQQSAIERFVWKGGALLVLGDHTDIGGIMQPINRLLRFTSIRLQFDSAIPLDTEWQWKRCLRGGWHPLFYGRTNDDFGISIGASLAVGSEARTLVVADRAFSDVGRPWYGVSRLGDMQRDPATEPLGGLVLVAEERHGRGVVQVWGDTSGFQDSSLTDNHAFIASLVYSLAASRSAGVPRWVVVSFVALLIGAFVILLRAVPIAIAVAMVSFVLSVYAVGWLAAWLWTPRPSLQGSAFALLDRSHGFFYPQSAPETRLYTLSETFLRARLPLLAMQSFAEGMRLQPRWWVIIAPTVPYTKQEARELEQYVESGGNLLIIAGASAAHSLHPLLKRFGMTITDSPLGAAHNSRIVSEPMRLAVAGAKPMPYSGANPTTAAPYDAEISFKEGYKITGDKATKPLVQCWGHTLVQYKRLGRGRVVLIGDSRFGLDENLGQREVRNEANIRFLLAILAEQQPEVLHSSNSVLERTVSDLP